MKKYVKAYNTAFDSDDGYVYKLKREGKPGTTLPADVTIRKRDYNDRGDTVYLDRPLSPAEMQQYDIPYKQQMQEYGASFTDPDVADYTEPQIIKQLRNLAYQYDWQITRNAITYDGKFYMELWNLAEDCRIEVIAPTTDDMKISSKVEFYVDSEPVNKRDIPQIIKERGDMSGYTSLTAKGNIVKSSSVVKAAYDDFDDFDEDPYSRYAELAHKSVPDADGFLTDYTLYKDRETGEYFCMFGDNELYPPDPSYADMEFETNESEAYAWFESYTGFADEDDTDGPAFWGYDL